MLLDFATISGIIEQVICIFTVSDVSCVSIRSFISNHPLSFIHDDNMLFIQVKSNFSCMYLVPSSICLSCYKEFLYINKINNILKVARENLALMLDIISHKIIMISLD